jgi:hypothetical protein
MVESQILIDRAWREAAVGEIIEVIDPSSRRRSPRSTPATADPRNSDPRAARRTTEAANGHQRRWPAGGFIADMRLHHVDHRLDERA